MILQKVYPRLADFSHSDYLRTRLPSSATPVSIHWPTKCLMCVRICITADRTWRKHLPFLSFHFVSTKHLTCGLASCTSVQTLSRRSPALRPRTFRHSMVVLSMKTVQLGITRACTCGVAAAPPDQQPGIVLSWPLRATRLADRQRCCRTLVCWLLTALLGLPSCPLPMRFMTSISPRFEAGTRDSNLAASGGDERLRLLWFQRCLEQR
jgi:hypothetical protein